MAYWSHILYLLFCSMKHIIQFKRKNYFFSLHQQLPQKTLAERWMGIPSFSLLCKSGQVLFISAMLLMSMDTCWQMHLWMFLVRKKCLYFSVFLIIHLSWLFTLLLHGLFAQAFVEVFSIWKLIYFLSLVKAPYTDTLGFLFVGYSWISLSVLLGKKHTCGILRNLEEFFFY